MHPYLVLHFPTLCPGTHALIKSLATLDCNVSMIHKLYMATMWSTHIQSCPFYLLYILYITHIMHNNNSRTNCWWSSKVPIDLLVIWSCLELVYHLERLAEHCWCTVWWSSQCTGSLLFHLTCVLGNRWYPTPADPHSGTTSWCFSFVNHLNGYKITNVWSTKDSHNKTLVIGFTHLHSLDTLVIHSHCLRQSWS